jgi:hypothetical protein
MKKWMWVFTAIIFCLSASSSWAKEPKEFAQEFFGSIQAGNISEAYDGLFAGSGIPPMKPQAVDMLKRQTASGLSMYGNVISYEIIHEEAFCKSIVRLVYALNQEVAPTIWQFFFYKPKDQWFLGHVMFNDQFQNIERMN